MKNKKIIIAVIALIAVAGLMLGLYFGTREKPEEKPQEKPQNTVSDPSATNPEAPQGSKEITVTVVHKDGTSKDFVYHTDEDYLGPVLETEGLVEGSRDAYGLYIKVVDGESAVYEVDGAYWAVYEGEESATTGVDSIVIHNGDTFKLVYTIG